MGKDQVMFIIYSVDFLMMLLMKKSTELGQERKTKKMGRGDTVYELTGTTEVG